jgi:GMP synthase-like glutamine amidotransferase
MKIQVLQHVPFEGLGSILPWAAINGHTVRTCGLYQNDPLPDPAKFDWLIVLGGPMGVYDETEYPWLADEKRLLPPSGPKKQYWEFAWARSLSLQCWAKK